MSAPGSEDRSAASSGATVGARPQGTAHSLTGTWTLTRFALRRDRLRTAIWTVALVGTLAMSVPALELMMTSDAERQARAALMRSPTGIIFAGPGFGLDDYTLGPMVVTELLMTLLIAVVIMNVLLVVRHTRTEEETGRAELIRAGVTGRRAAGTSALLLAVFVNGLIGLLVAPTLIGFGLPVADSLALGAGIALTGLSFAAITGVCAQVVEHARSAMGLAMLTFGVLFMFRVAGDIAEPGGNALSWLSPTSWVFQAKPFVDLRWWPLLLHVALIAALTVVASLLAARRDIGAGLVAPRAGPAHAARSLNSPFALHLRQQRGSLLAWTIGSALLGMSFGSLTSQLTDLLESSPQLAAFLGGDAGALTNGFVAAILVYVAMLAAAASIVSVLRLRGEESSGRAEAVLATATSRQAWMGSGVAVGLLTAVLTTVAGGLGLGLAAAATLQDGGYIATGVLASLNVAVLPIAFAGLAALSFGVSARLIALVWTWFVASLLLTVLGPILDVPAWVENISAFRHVAQYPAQDVAWTPIVIMAAGAALAIVLGLAGFRRRDLST